MPNGEPVVDVDVRDPDDFNHDLMDKIERKVPRSGGFNVQVYTFDLNEPERGDTVTLSNGVQGTVRGTDYPHEIGVKFDHDVEVPDGCNELSEYEGTWKTYCDPDAVEEFDW